MTAPDLSVGRSVIVEMIRLAALEVPGVIRVGRGGPAARAWFAGPPVNVRLRDGQVSVRLWVVARPRVALQPLAGQVRAAVKAAIERLLGLEVGTVTVIVDGVGA